jgi:Fe-S-cluster-containing hydrogenase component 2
MSILVNWLESLHEEMKISAACSREHNRKSSCSYCIDKCQHKAIEIKGNLLTINTSQCTLCGECVIACPLSAIDGAVSNRIFEKGSLVFDESYSPSEKELLIYKKRGMTSIQAVDVKLNQDWMTALTEANQKLQLLDESPIVVDQKIEGQSLSRRALFGSFRKEGKKLAISMAPASWRMEKDDWKLTKYYPDYQFYLVQINKEKCTLCQACFSLCAESVFAIKDGKLQVVNEKCVNCTSCTDICPENAIEIVSKIKRKSEQLESIYTKDCPDCGKPYYSFYMETEKCHVCVNRDPDWLSPY